jgi:DNA-binding PadR family transcriptional regulator
MKAKRDHNIHLSLTEETILMALLGGPRYGLEIVRAVEEGSEGKRKLGFGSLYPILHKLQKKGLVKSHWGEEKPEERGGARRRYYQVTALGQNVLRETQDIRSKIAAWKPANALLQMMFIVFRTLKTSENFILGRV